MSNRYQFVRYPGKPFPQTHPDRLATLGALYGMEPTDIFHARVLEIGCCDGGNLIPMAMSLPSSEFVGIDLTELDIVDARQTAAAIGLSNIQFHAMDLTELPGSLGKFDYIVAHGLYSWVPPEVREKLIAVIEASLTPHGIAYVSYNSQPGGHLRVMVREMMLFHLRGIEDRETKLIRAREFLGFMKISLDRSSLLGIVRRQVDLMLKQPDYGLFHDELSEHYQPVYLHQFLAHAERYRLKYLSESSYFVTRPEIIGSEAAEAFAKATAGFGNDPVPPAQYLDFVVCSHFHQTLLCRSETALDRPVRPERLKQFWFSSPSTVVPPGPGAEDAAESEAFVGPQGCRIATSSPFVRQLVHAIIDIYPRSVHYKDLESEERNQAELCGTLLALMNMGIIAAHLTSPEFSVTPGDRPVASPFARWQAARSRPLTDLRHCRVEIEDSLQSALVMLLDGTRNRVQLLAQLDPGLLPGDAKPALLEEALTTLARRCLLVS